MQTFAPTTDIHEIAWLLDYRRLGKQRVECLQILKALDALRTGDLYMTDKRGHKRKRGWVSHPCTPRSQKGCSRWLDLIRWYCHLETPFIALPLYPLRIVPVGGIFLDLR